MLHHLREGLWPKSFRLLHSSALFSTKNHPKSYQESLNNLRSQTGLNGNTPNAQDLDSIALKLKKGRLNLLPEYQRGVVWQADKASRLIVTALCNRIIPTITLHEKSPGIMDVVDGKQRLSALLTFFMFGDDKIEYEKLCSEGKLTREFRSLSKLDENYESLVGLTYDDLSEDAQRKFQAFSVPVLTIPYETHPDDVFEVYVDINSGGEDLSDQQLRKAAFYGEFIKKLSHLVQNEDFQRIRYSSKNFQKGVPTLCKKEKDEEMVLRAMAFERRINDYKPTMRSFLNAEVKHVNNLTHKERSDYMKKRTETFTKIMKILSNIFSESGGACRIWRKSKSKKEESWAWYNKISLSIWDSMYVAFSELLIKYDRPHMYIKCKDEIENSIKELFECGKIGADGMSRLKIIERKDTIKKAVEKVLQKSNSSTGSRRFPNETKLRNTLFKQQERLCSICKKSMDGSRIADGDYAHLDHVIPYSQGGVSTLENAALVHASCNLHKGARIL